MRFSILLPLALCGGFAAAADAPASKTTALDVKPVVLPTPEVQTQPLSAAPEAPAPKPGAKASAKGGSKLAAKKAKPAPKKAVKKLAKTATKKAARR